MVDCVRPVSVAQQMRGDIGVDAGRIAVRFIIPWTARSIRRLPPFRPPNTGSFVPASPLRDSRERLTISGSRASGLMSIA